VIPEGTGKSAIEDLKNRRTEVQVKVENKEEGYSYMWPFDKFNNRLYMIRDLINEFFESNKLPKLAKEEDPFWDPPEPILIGTAYLKLESLGVMFDNKLEASIVGNERGGQCGRIAVSYVPTDETGEAGEAPEEL
jgi:hypothetical protein